MSYKPLGEWTEEDILEYERRYEATLEEGL